MIILELFAPLTFVLSISLIKELIDDFSGYKRYIEVNSVKYEY